MGIIRPGVDDGRRWAISLDTDNYLVGTRAAVLAASELLARSGVLHAVYRRPGAYAEWELLAVIPVEIQLTDRP